MEKYDKLLNEIYFNNSLTEKQIGINCGYSQQYVSKIKNNIESLKYDPKIINKKICCLICDSDKNLIIHHNHETNKLIAIICKKCNLNIGNLDSFKLGDIIKHFKEFKRKEKYSKEWFSEKEIKKLFSSPKINTRDLLLMKVSYYGGLRVGETINSCKEDYRNEDYTYLLLRKQKTDKKNWDTQPIPEIIFGDVIRYCDDNNIKTQDYVFKSNRNKRISYNNVYKMVKKHCDGIGIDKEITTHSFRRSRAVHLLNNNISIYTVSKFLRHKDIVTTQKYLKLSKKRLADEIAKVDNKLIFSDI